jgi:WD40 repeat protein
MGRMTGELTRAGTCRRVAVLILLTAAVMLLPFPPQAAAQTLEEQCHLKLGNGIGGAVFSADGHWLAGAQGNVVKVWDVRSITRPRSPAHQETTTAALPQPQTLIGHEQEITALAFLRDAKTVASGGLEGSIRLWDVGSGRLREVLTGHHRPVTVLVSSPDSRLLASGSEDATVCVWEVATGKRLATLSGQIGEAVALAFSPTGGTLAVASADAEIRIWDPKTGEPQRTIADRLLTTFALAYSADGKTLFAGGVDQKITLLDAGTGQVRKALTGQPELVACLALQPGGRLLISAGFKAERAAAPTQLFVWDRESGQVKQRLARPHGMNSVNFSADGRLLFGSNMDRTVTVWSVQ